ncbi:UB Xdomain protein Ubx3 [Schizosaccharomyces japonicus yFS275]|uniref:UB Xdomain protein Ubx3 n=1 Tax=Schizosaccharomyces japonicus (strain yFS275 / FY16936) TaxID=402676 RepID=B6JY07_SCHJY|nr:UB Xdomain protein Ubx3 [Schizosaccharomyces japonicus yFS275]EEB06425.1 UB Xdomain protein Ubx3 [Schizosaccharomyces japonicus yFS275]
MDKEELLDRFCNETGIDSTQGRFFLESSNWNYDLARMLFREVLPTESSQSSSLESGSSAHATGKASSAQHGQSSQAKPSASSSKPRNQHKKIATFRDLRNDESDEDNDNPNLFTGGEKSGLSVQGNNNDSKRHLIQQIFEKARQQGSVTPPGAENTASASHWTGHGTRLGTSASPSASEPETHAPSSQPASAAVLPTVERTLNFWKNGFSVDDGPLYNYDDPLNQETLRLINSGRAPLGLLNVAPNQPVNVIVQRRMDEEYHPKAKPFSGKGQRLGSSLTSTPIAAPSRPSTSVQSNVSSETSAQHSPIQVDEAKPSTRIQVRMLNGSREVVRLNLSHTIGDLYTAVRSRSAEQSFILCVPFPAKTLDNMDMSIEEAQLKNASLVQKHT